MNTAVVGAGIIGRLLALQLRRQGHAVTVFDARAFDDTSSTSHVAAGMISPYAEIAQGSDRAIIEMGKDSLTRWKDILPLLMNPPELNDRGSLMIASEKDTEELDFIIHRFKQMGLTFHVLSESALHAAEPALASSQHRGVYLPDEGCIDAQQLMQSLANTLRCQRTTWHASTTVQSIIKHRVKTLLQTHEFDKVFDTRGLGASLAGLRPVRGELVHVHAPQIQITRPIRLNHPRYPIYLVPRQNGHYVIGATMIESADTSPISVLSTMELLSACHAIHPGFSQARITHTATQCRPTLPDNLPMVQETEDCIHVNGLYRHGYLLGPYLVKKAMER